jgi:iron complex transport system substrate-binding protein
LRIVSLVPSLTETVCRFGFKEQIVGCTNYCVEPKGLHRLTTLIGGTKNPDIDLVKKLKPTHILVNLEENKPEHIELCNGIAPTFECMPKILDDIEPLLKDMGEFLGVKEAAVGFAKRFYEARKTLQTTFNSIESKRFLYFIWRDPWMVAGRDTYISSLFHEIGWINAAPTVIERYPTLFLDQLPRLDADIVFLSTEPYPFRKRDEERLKELWPDAPQIKKIDGRLMSWYGTTSIDAVEKVSKIICDYSACMVSSGNRQ